MVVVAEASSFRGGIDVLRALPGMVVVTLAEHSAVSMMNEFSRWDQVKAPIHTHQSTP